MATWKISNYYKKNAVERQIWTKDDITVIIDEGPRWGKWTCSSDQKPNIDLSNLDGYNLTSEDYDWEMEEMDDGSWQEFVYPDSMDQDERERLEELWNEESLEGLENSGWMNTDVEYWIYGPIKLTNLDTGEEFIGDQ